MKLITMILPFALAASTLAAQNDQTKDTEAIRQIVQDMEDGWNKPSGELFASHFAEEHDYVVWTGMYLPNQSRAANAGIHQELLSGIYKGSKNRLVLDKVRFVRKDVAIVHVYAHATFPGQPEPDYPAMIISMVLEKSEGDWKIVSFHNLNIEYDKLLRTEDPDPRAIESFSNKMYSSWKK